MLGASSFALQSHRGVSPECPAANMWSLQTFSRLSSSLGASALPQGVGAAVLGAGACKLRGFAAKAEPVCADIEVELDRDDPEAVDKQSLWEAPKAAPMEPVDLDTEFDRDDPELADKRNLWEAPQAQQLAEVDLDTEFDRDDPLLADKERLWEPKSCPEPANIDAELDLMEEGEKIVARAAAGMSEPQPSGHAKQFA